MSRCHFVACFIGVAGIVIGLSGCVVPAPVSGQAHADAAARIACEQRAEQAYEQQNRGDIYRPASQVNTPYSANYGPSQTDRGLSDLFVHDRMVSNCIRNTGAGTEINSSSVPRAR